MNNTQEFRSEVGKLMHMDFDQNFGYKFLVWFDYTKKLMRELKVGDLFAVPNFLYTDEEWHMSILSAANIMPFHYAAAGDEMSGYPVFLEKTRDEAFYDFYKQDDNSTEETTKIRVVAAPTGLELVKNNNSSGSGSNNTNDKIQILEESQIPIFGGEVRILDSEMVSTIFNNGLDLNQTFSIGKIRKGDVDIRLKVDDLVKTHIGIFGYTGTGKSNLASTLIYKLLTQSARPVKIVVFDLMGEYFALLADVLEKVGGFVCYLESQSLPEDAQNYMAGQGSMDKARDAILRNTHMPSGLRGSNTFWNYQHVLGKLLERGQVKVRHQRYDTLEKFLQQNIASHKDSQESRQTMGMIFGRFKTRSFTKENLEELEEELQKELRNPDLKVGTSDLLKGWLEAVRKQNTAFFEPKEQYKTRNNDMVDILLGKYGNDSATNTREEKEGERRFIHGKYNTPNSSSLYIIESEYEDEIRKFAHDLICGNEYSVYGERRKRGWNSPLVLFMLDEADEFIPQEPTGTYKNSTEAVETVARRGRKFGLGVAIATQRVTYLNTNIMAQPHTYFISKLPRMSDRQRITDAFGTSEDMLRETFKFKRGDWLTISHDATGMKSIPIPIHADNAEERIRANKILENW